MLVRALLLCLLLASGAQAATTFKVPFSVVPGSVTFTPEGHATTTTSVPASFPVSVQVVADSSLPNCAAGLVTVDAEIVDSGLELQVDGYAAGSLCSIGGSVDFEMQVEVPELGGTSTTVRLVPISLSFDFIDYDHVMAGISTGGHTSSATPEAQIAVHAPDPQFDWDASSPDPSQPANTLYTSVEHWTPGDTVTFPVNLQIVIRGNTAHPAQGAARVRYEYRVTVPEPSAALPLGVATLAGLASMRGR